MDEVNEMEQHKNYHIISFDLKSLFTDVPLNDTTDIDLWCIYIKKETNKNLTKKELKAPILRWANKIYFVSNNLILTQVD